MIVTLAICFALGLALSYSPLPRLVRKNPTLLVLCLGLYLACSAFTCNASATLGTITALLPALTSLAESIVAFVMGLSGKTVSISLATSITTWSANVGTEITNIQGIIAAATASTTATTLQKLQAAFTAIQSELGSILSGANITDTATVSKFSSLAGLFIAAVQTILGIILSLQPAAAKYDAKQISEADAQTADKHAASLVDHSHKVLKDTYHTIVTTPTESEAVNESLAALNPKLP